MKVVCISDSHMSHHELLVPEGDVVVHAGDAGNRGSIRELRDFISWLAALPHKNKIYVAGNHDLVMQFSPLESQALRDEMESLGIHYLQDSFIVIDGVKFYGAPWQPNFGFGFAFNLARGKDIKEKWDLIPDDVDVLISHGPPHGILDHVNESFMKFAKHPGESARMVNKKRSVGCEELAKALKSGRIRPKLHIFGHIHEGYGMQNENGCVFVNAACMDKNYDAANPIQVVEIK